MSSWKNRVCKWLQGNLQADAHWLCLLAKLCWQALVQLKMQGDTVTNIPAGSPLAFVVRGVELWVCSSGRLVRSFRRCSFVHRMEMSGQLDATTTLSPENDL